MKLAVRVDVAGQPGLDHYNLPLGVKHLLLGYLRKMGLSPECAYAKDAYASAAKAIERGMVDGRLVAGMALLEAKFNTNLFFLPSGIGPSMLKRLPEEMAKHAGAIAAYVVGQSLTERLIKRLTGHVSPVKRDLLDRLHEWHPDLIRLEQDITAGKFAQVA